MHRFMLGDDLELTTRGERSMDERVLAYGDRAVNETADAVLDDRALELSGGKSPQRKGSRQA